MDIEKVMEKKEFSKLPKEVVARALDISKGDVKMARALLRKYFGVFLINKILKAKNLDEGILEKHISSKGRDYGVLYGKIFDVVGVDIELQFGFRDNNFPAQDSLQDSNENLSGANLSPTSPEIAKTKLIPLCFEKVPSSLGIKTVVDLGCGVNGFSYGFLPRGLTYVGIEAVGQLVDLTNKYFKDRGFEQAHVFHRDLFDLRFVKDILNKLGSVKPRVVFLFQVIDALESFEKDFSKKFLKEIIGGCEFIVLSLPLKSISSKTKFAVNRKWLVDFLDEEFEVLGDFKTRTERFICVRHK